MQKAIWKQFLIVFVLLSLAFKSIENTSNGLFFYDDFEHYRNNTQIASAYQTWDDGAVIKTLLEREDVHTGRKAMRVEIISPNERSGSTIGSIFHNLSGNQRNWSLGTAVRFWVKNPDQELLLLTFNFKEAYNEYWAVNSKGIFFLEPEPGEYQKKEIEYGNLPIPANYSGFVVIPFSSFIVPDWNTAWGNENMELHHIATFSFGLTLGRNYPAHFLLDDIQIVDTNPSFYLEIYRNNTIIFTPDDTYSRFKINAYLVNPEYQEIKEVQPDCIIKHQSDMVQIDQDGWLTISSGNKEQEITVFCEYTHEDKKYFDEFRVSLITSESSTAELAESLSPAIPAVEYAETAGSRQLSPFDAWAYHNRPQFVVISTGLTLILVIILSAYQKRI